MITVREKLNEFYSFSKEARLAAENDQLKKRLRLLFKEIQLEVDDYIKLRNNEEYMKLRDLIIKECDLVGINLEEAIIFCEKYLND